LRGRNLEWEVSRSFGLISTDSLVNLEHFDINLMGAADCGYMVDQKNDQKWILRG